MLPGKRDFTAAVKRGVAPHTRKQRVLAAISKLRSAFFTGYKNKICTYTIQFARTIYILGKWLPLESELESFPIFFSSSIALLSSLLSCNFYLLDLKTISSVDILEMT